MKATLHILLTVILLVGTSGLKLDAHYCHDKLTEINFGQPEDDCCNGTSCKHCKDELIIIDLNTDLVTAAQNSFHYNPFYFTELDIVNLITAYQAENPEKIVINIIKFKIPTKTRLAMMQRYLC